MTESPMNIQERAKAATAELLERRAIAPPAVASVEWIIARYFADLGTVAAERDRLAGQVRDLYCAIWACPLDEYGDVDHAETVAEAVRDSLAAARLEQAEALLRRMARRDPWGDSPDVPVTDYAAYAIAAQRFVEELDHV